MDGLWTMELGRAWTSKMLSMQGSNSQRILHNIQSTFSVIRRNRIYHNIYLTHRFASFASFTTSVQCRVSTRIL